MGLSPRVVTETRLILWDGVTQRLPKGQVMDVPPGSPLEAAIGAQFLVPMPGAEAQAPAPQDGTAAAPSAFAGSGPASAVEVPPAVPAKKQASAKEEGS
jgi:hypothetical protein